MTVIGITAEPTYVAEALKNVLKIIFQLDVLLQIQIVPLLIIVIFQLKLMLVLNF